MAYQFYGWETANVSAITDKYKTIKTPTDLYDALSAIWCAETCAPRMRAEWTPENRTLGQCSITAFLAQDIFGGKVYGILRPGGNYHCYNVIGDCIFDLTSEQFGDEVLVYENNPEQFRDVHFAKEEKRLRYEYLKRELDRSVNPWFTIDEMDPDTYIISEYRHWEETHCYLLNGSDRSLLIDTGLGICNIYDEVVKLTHKPITAVATHIHWDHIGGHQYFPDFYAHSAELDWLNGKFPLSIETIKEMVMDRCDLPEGFQIDDYVFFQGMPAKVVTDHDCIDIGSRNIEVLHTPGHSPGHLCFWEKERGYLFTGDLVYKDTLFAYYPSTDPAAYLASLEKIAKLPATKVCPAHHSLDIKPELIDRMKMAFRQLEKDGKLHHGSGIFDYGDWAVWL